MARKHEKLYIVWKGIKSRVTGKNRHNSSSYLERGVTRCKEWDDYAVFREWSLNTGYKDGLSIDRRDNTKGYSPDNCRWVTPYIQACNQLKRKDNKSGYKGVSFNTSKGKWVAQIQINGAKVYLGSFLNVEDAVNAYDGYIEEHNLPHTTNRGIL